MRSGSFTRNWLGSEPSRNAGVSSGGRAGLRGGWALGGCGPRGAGCRVRGSTGDAVLTMSDLAPGLVLGENVKLGEDVVLGAHVVIHDGVEVGDGCTIQDGVVLGKTPVLAPTSSASRDRL